MSCGEGSLDQPRRAGGRGEDGQRGESSPRLIDAGGFEDAVAHVHRCSRVPWLTLAFDEDSEAKGRSSAVTGELILSRPRRFAADVVLPLGTWTASRTLGAAALPKLTCPPTAVSRVDGIRRQGSCR
jgi:hypothetical protein